ncbi:MAG: choice-of-anchor B family protein [Gemmatimonadetes bacterium]|nr:choice-of-anchor B family protein [Gemmatimonadota bacterium]
MKSRLRFPAIAMLFVACSDGPLEPDTVDPNFTARCVGGMADQYPCDAVDLVAHIALADLEPGSSNFAQTNDVWGWTDETTGAEYALVGRDNGVTFVDLSDPRNPSPIGRLASPTGSSPWRDIKVHADHAYIVADGAPGHGIQIFDLGRLRGVTEFTEFDEDGRYTGVSSVHNIAINEATGFAYSVGNNSGGNTCGGGLHMIDLSNATSPAFAGCYAAIGTGFGGGGYTHDVQCVVYDGPDTEHQGREICIGSNETAIMTADVTDKASPFLLGTGQYPDVGYVHQGWLSEDHRYFYQNDEGDEASGTVSRTRLLIWDLEDLDDPVLAGEHFGPTEAIDHNLYVHGTTLYHSNYTFGIRVLDITQPDDPVERGFFDTVPGTNAVSFAGSWSNYPFFDSGVIVVTSANEGLFLLRLQ